MWGLVVTFGEIALRLSREQAAAPGSYGPASPGTDGANAGAEDAGTLGIRRHDHFVTESTGGAQRWS